MVETSEPVKTAVVKPENVTKLRDMFDRWKGVKKRSEDTIKAVERALVPFEQRTGNPAVQLINLKASSGCRCSLAKSFRPSLRGPRTLPTGCNFWAFYTGARVGELCQLRVQDVEQTKAGPFLRITEEAERATVKTAAGIRRVPVVWLGFVDYLEATRKVGAINLWPAMKFRRGSPVPVSRIG